MSDGITDANRLSASRIEIWRQKTKEEFIHNLTTQELLSELKKRYRSEPAIMDYIEMIECEL
jgi:hypothetical protein